MLPGGRNLERQAAYSDYPYMTTMAAARAAVKGIAAYRGKDVEVASLQSYHAGII